MNKDFDVERVNDELARSHSIDDYYARSPLPVRLIERRRLAIIRRFLGDVQGKDLIEVGSGGGHVLALFPEARRVALDVSDEYLALAKKRLGTRGVTFLKGELPTAGLADRSFDRVICTEVLEHTVRPEEILEQIARVLRPEGIAVITVPNDPLILDLKGLVRRSPLSRFFEGRIEWGGDKYHLHTWSPEAFEALLSKHFRVTDRDFAPHRTMPIRACYRCETK